MLKCKVVVEFVQFALVPKACIGENGLCARKGHDGAPTPHLRTSSMFCYGNAAPSYHRRLPSTSVLYKQIIGLIQTDYLQINLLEKEVLPFWISAKLRVQHLGMAG